MRLEQLRPIREAHCYRQLLFLRELLASRRPFQLYLICPFREIKVCSAAVQGLFQTLFSLLDTIFVVLARFLLLSRLALASGIHDRRPASRARMKRSGLDLRLAPPRAPISRI